MRDGIKVTAKTVKVYDIPIRHRPFENDPDLRRTLNRLGSPNSRLGSCAKRTYLSNDELQTKRVIAKPVTRQEEIEDRWKTLTQEIGSVA